MGIYDSPNSINLSDVSPQLLQMATDQMNSLGGGIVYLPAGDFPFNPPTNGVGTTVPAGVHLIGQGKGVTILRETIECRESFMIKGDGMSQAYNTPDLQNLQKPIKIANISFKGLVPSRADADSTTNNSGVTFNCVKDFMLLNCDFNNFVNSAASAGNNMGWDVSAYLMRGVMSHCDFDNTYKDDLAIANRIWGYGIIAGGTGYWVGTPAVRELLGQYGLNTVFIEDCTFRRSRHSIASSQASYYVARHNYFTDLVQNFYGSFIDAHGSSKGFEVYENTIVDVPTDYRTSLTPPEQYIGQYLSRGINPRGGRGVIFNNRIEKCGSNGVGLSNDGGTVPDAPISETKTQDVFIWGNTFLDVPNQIVDDGSVILNTDYFLREPNMAQDGFTYVPYPYPHPLVLGNQGVVSVNSTIPNARFTIGTV